jgi:hypothetical protein
MTQTTVHRILLKANKLQVIQKITASNKQLRSQFAAHTCAQISEHDNILSRIVFTDEAKFRISGRVNRHNCVIWGSKPLREHFEHEQHSPKVNSGAR